MARADWIIETMQRGHSDPRIEYIRLEVARDFLTSGYHCVAAANNIICDGHSMVAMAHPHTF